MRETRTNKSSLEQEPDQILDISVAGIALNLFLKLGKNGMAWVDLQSLLGLHIRGHIAVLKSLSLHDSLHIGRPSPLRSDQDTRRISKSETQLTLFDLVSQNFLEMFTKWFKLNLLLLLEFLLIFSELELETLLSTVSEFLSLELLKLLDDILINWISHVEDIKVSLFKRLKER